MLITSCRIFQLSFVSDIPSNATCVQTALLHVIIVAMGVMLGASGNTKCVVAYIDVHTVDIKNRTGLTHYVWNLLRVCECNLSICCNIPRLDSQCDCHQEKKLCVRTHRLRLDTPGARDALDVPWQGTYRSQQKTHRQCEFGRSTSWFRAFGHSMPGRRVSGRSSPRHRASGRSWHGICLSDGACQGIFFLDAALSGHFLLDRTCQGIFLLDAAVSGNFLLDTAVSGYFPSGRSHIRALPTGRSRDRANGIRTTRVMAPRSCWLSRHGTSQQILSSHS